MSVSTLAILLLTDSESQTLSRDQEVNGSFTSRIRDLESANSELHDELDCLRMTLEESKSEREDLQVRISDLENEIETMRSQNRSMKGDLTRTAHVLPNALHLLQATKRVNITTSAENP